MSVGFSDARSDRYPPESQMPTSKPISVKKWRSIRKLAMTPRTFLQQKLTEIKDKVEKSEAALNDYRRKRGIVTDLNQDPTKPEQGQPLLQRLNELNSELSKASGDKIKLETLHQLVEHGHYESLPEVLNNPVIQELKEESAKLSAEYASLVTDLIRATIHSTT